MALFSRFFICCSLITFLAMVSFWTNAPRPSRNVASLGEYYGPPKFHYDPSFKL